MNFVIVLCAVILGASAVPSQLHLEQFHQFKLQHGKTYGSSEEEQLRLKIFSDNLKTIDEHNARYEQGLETYEMGVNQFTDLTSEEFQQYLTLQKPPPEPENVTYWEPTNVDIPASIDWRQYGAVTPARQQGTCGSCWSFSAVGATESAVFLATGQLIPLSPQNLVDCDRNSLGCKSGWVDKAFSYIALNGIAAESSYPYEGRYGVCRQVPPVVRIRGYRNVPRNEIALRDAVGTVGPVSVTVNSGPIRHYKRGVFYDASCGNQATDHAVLVVGYGNDGRNDYWIVKNSWGGQWGEGGYFRLIRNYYNHCGIANTPMFPIV